MLTIAALLRHFCSCSRAGSQELSVTGTKTDPRGVDASKGRVFPGDAADEEFKADGKILQPIVALRMQVARRSRRQYGCC